MEARDTLRDILDLGAKQMRFDSAVKTIFSDKRVLAVLLQETMPEYSHIPPRVISGKFVVDYASFLPPKDDSSPRTQQALTTATEILGPSGRAADLDVLFLARTPLQNHQWNGQIVNIEFQNTSPSSYDILNRAIYYVSGIIFKQYGRTFSNSQYNYLLKSSSIWICPWLRKDREDSVNRYSLAESIITGGYHAPAQLYDLAQIIIVHFNPDGPTHSSRLIGLLQTLFTSKLSPEEKIRILADRYSIIIEEKEVRNMVDFSEVYMQLGREEGREEGLTKGREEGLTKGREEGLTKGREEGLAKGLCLSFSELASEGDSPCTIKMALRYIRKHLLKLEDILDFLSPHEIAEIKRHLLQDSSIHPA